MSNRGRDNSDLTAVDLAILAIVAEGDRQQIGITGREIAGLVGVPGRAIGSRMSALAKRGLVRGSFYAGMNTWFITERGELEVRRAR